MKKLIPLCLLAASAAAASAASSPQIDLSYYSSLNGLSGASLKQAVFNLVGPDDSYVYLKYGSGNKATWWGFYLTDRTENNEVIDRYSYDVRYYGSQGSSVSGMNIEHSFAQSWWEGGSARMSYRDLYNLMPCESGINNSKSNYVMGLVTTVNKTNGCTKVGDSSWGVKVWEPADEWKGDFARGYMYMATAYQDLTWKSAGTNILEQNAYPTLKPRAYELYLQWARADEVNAEETERNQAVSDIQGNRNPFVDFPNLMEYVWGDSTSVPLNLLTTVKSAPTSGMVIDPGETESVLYDESMLASNTGNCTVDNILLPSALKQVWQHDATYGWKASAYKGTAYAADAVLYTPEIDMTTYASGNLSFAHAVNHAASPAAVLSVLAETSEGETVELAVPNWPEGNSWAFSASGNVSLNKLAGKKFRIGFRYTSTTSEAATWEVQKVKVTAIGKYNGIETVPTYLQPETDNSLFPAEYYSLDGRRVDPATFRGIVIRRQGSSITKLILR